MNGAASHHVESVTEFLADTYEHAQVLDAALHRVIHDLRSRLYALGLADDPEVARRIEAAKAQIEAGDLSDFIDAEEFAAAYPAHR
ncbi:MAG: hypothetical protein ACRDHK_14450 [Actinomycetota bacterium]